MRKASGRYSISAIARECGLSAMTVSRALRGSDSVRPETSSGYIRNPVLGRPAFQKSEKHSRVEVIMGTTGKSVTFFHTQLLAATEQYLAEKGYDCVVRTCSGDYNQFLQLLENVRLSHALRPA
ncbi:MAG: hypothetical protein ACYTFY_22380 [Planctomycetota bacterium]|jgi:DNA-binding LacI/PurR family transcriptional regulator